MTAGEVASLFLAASEIGPYPDEASCSALAVFMTANIVTPVATDQREELRQARVREAYRLLQAEIDKRRIPDENGIVWSTPEMLGLRGALSACRSEFVGTENPKTAKMAEWGVKSVVFWCVMSAVLKELGRSTRLTRQSVAIRLTAAALRRVGYPSATEPAVARHLSLHFSDLGESP